MAVFSCSRDQETMDPDDLFLALKGILQQIKVGLDSLDTKGNVVLFLIGVLIVFSLKLCIPMCLLSSQYDQNGLVINKAMLIKSFKCCMPPRLTSGRPTTSVFSIIG